MAKLLSDQVDSGEIAVIMRELKGVINRGIDGDVVEFGCYVGTTSVYIATMLEYTSKKFYVYDSFEGLPEKSSKDISPLGEQFKPGELCATKKQFIRNLIQAGAPLPIIKKGWFSDLTSNDVPDKIAFAFLDGDYYSSVMDSLNLIEKHMTSGSVIIVDDYGNQALPGAGLAVDEWLRTRAASKRIENSLAIVTLK